MRESQESNGSNHQFDDKWVQEVRDKIGKGKKSL